MNKFYLVILTILNVNLFAQPSCQWAYIPDGTNAYNTITNLAIDRTGDIIQTGQMLGAADMDPGLAPGDTAFTKPGYNFYISKTDINGHLKWVRYFSSLGSFVSFQFTGLEVNSNNEIIVLGKFFGLIDFDLSDNGVDTLRSHFPTYPDYFIAKYDSSSNLLWAINIGDSTTHDIDAMAMTLLSNDNIVISANPNGPIDVDPGPSIHYSNSINANIICYDSNGNYIWNNNISPIYSYGYDFNTLSSDGNNSYLLSVGYYELTVNKFDNMGTLLWSKTIGDFSSMARVDPMSILVDKSNGDFYVAGTFGDTVDFDPGPSTVNRINTSINYQDGFIAKYDSSMNLLWVNEYDGEVKFGHFSLEYSGNDILAVGSITGQIDFGNGIILSSASQISPFYLKINSSGIAQDGYTLNGSGGYNFIKNAGSGTFVTGGNIAPNTDMDPTSANLAINGTTSNHFTAVYLEAATSVSEINKVNNIDVFPNPSNGSFYLSSKEFIKYGKIEIYNIVGEIIYSESISDFSQKEIQIRNVPKGIYLLKVMDGEKENIQNMIVD